MKENNCSVKRLVNVQEGRKFHLGAIFMPMDSENLHRLRNDQSGALHFNLLLKRMD